MKYKNSAIMTIGKKKCCGCFACKYICPVKAIEIKIIDGFFYPIVDSTKCNNCGLCSKYCPIIIKTNFNKGSPKIFSAISKNKKNLMKSSSGGVFGELAKDMLMKNGLVCAVRWGRNWIAEHKIVNKILEINSLRGSKYVQSKMINYGKIIDIAKKKKILFVGTPCQVAALNNFIDGNKTIKRNIITCDLICHGVASYDKFYKYLKNLEKKYKSKIVSINFRSKKTGWLDYSVEIKFDNKEIYLRSHKIDRFMINYLQNIYLRPSCYDCEFACIPRYGDITLGDYWGCKFAKQSEGVSLIFINKNLSFPNSLSDRFKIENNIPNNFFQFNRIILKKLRKQRRTYLLKVIRYYLSILTKTN